MSILRSGQLRWYKKAAVSGRWSTYVQAANEEEVRWMHMQDLISVARFADRYPGPYTVEMLPPNFTPPAKARQTHNEEGATAQTEKEGHPDREQGAQSGASVKDAAAPSAHPTPGGITPRSPGG